MNEHRRLCAWLNLINRISPWEFHVRKIYIVSSSCAAHVNLWTAWRTYIFIYLCKGWVGEEQGKCIYTKCAHQFITHWIYYIYLLTRRAPHVKQAISYCYWMRPALLMHNPDDTMRNHTRTLLLPQQKDCCRYIVNVTTVWYSVNISKYAHHLPHLISRLEHFIFV